VAITFGQFQGSVALDGVCEVDWLETWRFGFHLSPMIHEVLCEDWKGTVKNVPFRSNKGDS
jgi:hypothetical protein